jgi:CheY-like chemotaxis protein
MPRVLVLEDDVLIAMDLDSLLQAAGCTVLGPGPSEAAALDLIENARPYIALVDINLGAGSTFGVADWLAKKKIPFAFLTGYGPGVLPPAHAERPVFSKPYEASNLARDVMALADGRTR